MIILTAIQKWIVNTWLLILFIIYYIKEQSLLLHEEHDLFALLKEL